MTSETDDVVDGILDIVAAYANLSIEMSSLSYDEDLFHAGMTSYASVQVMLELERRFGIEFPRRCFVKAPSSRFHRFAPRSASCS